MNKKKNLGAQCIHCDQPADCIGSVGTTPHHTPHPTPIDQFDFVILKYLTRESIPINYINKLMNMK